MSWRTSGVVLAMRNIGRALGLNRRIAPLLQGGGYEARYDLEFSRHLRPGDCVWDVGANVGYYTSAFAERVGPNGRVCAFEPSSINFERLAERCSAMSNVTLFRCGLGKTNGKLKLLQGEDALGASSRITGEASSGDLVEIRSGDNLLVDGAASDPDALKVDVEGFEWEVLNGMLGMLARSRIRLIGIEVHFGILKERGLGRIPREIEKLLQTSGFSVGWPDSSHILAVRNR